jgi:hypothetical protein
MGWSLPRKTIDPVCGKRSHPVKAGIAAVSESPILPGQPTAVFSSNRTHIFVELPRQIHSCRQSQKAEPLENGPPVGFRIRQRPKRLHNRCLRVYILFLNHRLYAKIFLGVTPPRSTASPAEKGQWPWFST